MYSACPIYITIKPSRVMNLLQSSLDMLPNWIEHSLWANAHTNPQSILFRSKPRETHISDWIGRPRGSAGVRIDNRSTLRNVSLLTITIKKENRLQNNTFCTRYSLQMSSLKRPFHDQAPGPKRSAWQLPASCDFCRLKKIRCDKKRPCSSCKDRDTVCEYSEGR